MNTNITLPPKVRLTIYIVSVLGTAIVLPLYAAHVVGDVVLAVWTSVSAAANGLAAFNVQVSDK